MSKNRIEYVIGRNDNDTFYAEIDGHREQLELVKIGEQHHVASKTVVKRVLDLLKEVEYLKELNESKSEELKVQQEWMSQWERIRGLES